jgi:hypothetical protein
MTRVIQPWMSKTKTLPKPSPRRSLHSTPVLAKASVPGDVLGVQGLLAAAEVADLFEGA